MNQSRNKEDLIWKGKDYQARTVSLYVQERDHIMEHEIVQDNFTAVYDTIESPDTVYQSAESSDREVFFKRSEEATYGKGLLTKAVVEYTMEGGDGFVVSAWPQREEKGGIADKLYPES